MLTSLYFSPDYLQARGIMGMISVNDKGYLIGEFGKFDKKKYCINISI